MNKPNLIPPDMNQCQAEQRLGSFMTLGPRSLIRCTNRPVWLATERKPGEDGLKGSMTLCHGCAERMKKKLGRNHCVFTPIDLKGREE